MGYTDKRYKKGVAHIVQRIRSGDPEVFS